MAIAPLPTSLLYFIYLHTLERHKKHGYPLRLEISFLLDSGAFLCERKYPTHNTIAKRLNITCDNVTSQISETSTVANQTEVPLSHCVTLNLNTTTEDNSHQHLILFAIADTKNNILGTAFFE